MNINNTQTQNAVVAPDCEPERTESVEDYGAQRSEESIPDTLRMVTPEDAARAGLRSIILTLGLDEVLVLGRIAERLRKGQQQYGFLHLSSDRRSFRSTEAREELEDALVYLACAWLKSETREVTG
jgi:hypothetical protein